MSVRHWNDRVGKLSEEGDGYSGFFNEEQTVNGHPCQVGYEVSRTLGQMRSETPGVMTKPGSWARLSGSSVKRRPYFKPIGGHLTRRLSYSTFAARGMGSGEGRTRKPEVIGADHPREFNPTWPVEPFPVTRTRQFVANQRSAYFPWT